MEPQELKSILECLLFVSDKPLSITTFKSILGDVDRRLVLESLDELKQSYDRESRAFHLIEIAEGYQLATRVEYAPWIRKLYKSKVNSKLSRAALETLAIIAYRQPLSKMEIEDIRGVSADGVIASLLERKLIRIVGRKEVMGRPLIYGTTKDFLHYFGLKDLADMPELKNLQDMLAMDENSESWDMGTDGELVPKNKPLDTESDPSSPTGEVQVTPASNPLAEPLAKEQAEIEDDDHCPELAP